MPGEQGGGAGEGRQIPGRAVQPERRGETALPDGPAIKGRNTPARLPPRFPAPGKCTSHLGFGLDTLDTVVEVLSLLVVGQRQIERKIVSLDVDVTMVKAVMEGEEVHGY